MSEFVALNASPSTNSKTHALAACAIEIAGGGRLIDLSTLDAEGLLGRREAADVHEAMEQIRTASVLFIATPIYRATYSGLLKVLFDQFEQRALADVVCVLAATGGSHHHFLALDTGLRPMVTSLAGTSVPTAVYAVSTDFDSGGTPVEAIRAQLEKALEEADGLARAITPD
jgi:FMN reductase